MAKLSINGMSKENEGIIFQKINETLEWFNANKETASTEELKNNLAEIQNIVTPILTKTSQSTKIEDL